MEKLNFSMSRFLWMPKWPFFYIIGNERAQHNLQILRQTSNGPSGFDDLYYSLKTKKDGVQKLAQSVDRDRFFVWQVSHC